jgi:hypothetical protein
MEIQRAISQGATWPIAMNQIPPLLELIDEQRIPVDICLTQGIGTVSLRAESVFCRRRLRSLVLEVADNSVRVDLDQLEEARVVSRSAGKQRQISLHLAGKSGTASLTIIGPTPARGLAGQVWQLVMDSLLTDSPKALEQGVVASPVLPVLQSVDGAKPPEPGRTGWTKGQNRSGFAGVRLAIGSQG